MGDNVGLFVGASDRSHAPSLVHSGRWGQKVQSPSSVQTFCFSKKRSCGVHSRFVGALVGMAVGTMVGSAVVGMAVGEGVGWAEGSSVGAKVGAVVGTPVGGRVAAQSFAQREGHTSAMGTLSHKNACPQTAFFSSSPASPSPPMYATSDWHTGRSSEHLAVGPDVGETVGIGVGSLLGKEVGASVASAGTHLPQVKGHRAVLSSSPQGSGSAEQKLNRAPFSSCEWA